MCVLLCIPCVHFINGNGVLFFWGFVLVFFNRRQETENAWNMALDMSLGSCLLVSFF